MGVMSLPVRDGRADPEVGAESSADVLVEVLTGQYPSLVRLAAMLLDDAHAAEDVVQDAYVRVAARHYRLRDPHLALAYLRQTVVNLARNSLRRRLLARRHVASSLPDAASAEEAAIDRFERQSVIRGLRALSRRYREVLVLRYYLDCSVEDTRRHRPRWTHADRRSRGLHLAGLRRGRPGRRGRPHHDEPRRQVQGPQAEPPRHPNRPGTAAIPISGSATTRAGS
jgi:RNA polymerase sigma factor (sigma-70 family)